MSVRSCEWCFVPYKFYASLSGCMLAEYNRSDFAFRVNKIYYVYFYSVKTMISCDCSGLVEFTNK